MFKLFISKEYLFFTHTHTHTHTHTLLTFPLSVLASPTINKLEKDYNAMGPGMLDSRGFNMI
jgi:hypothetical protein